MFLEISRRGAAIGLAGLALGFSSRRAATQQHGGSTPSTPAPGQINGSAVPADPLGESNTQGPFSDADGRQVKAREEDRQRHLVADANRLLVLATSLRDEVAKTDRHILSIEVVKRADEIERLAHAVKERMKG